MNKRAIVIGGNHHNTLGVIRSLGERGIMPLVVIQCHEKNPYISLSRYIQQCWIVETETEVLNILRQEAEKKTFEKTVLIACADNLSSLVDMNCEELKQWYYLPGAERQGQITRLMNKKVMSDLAQEVGFLVPDSTAIDTSSDQIVKLTLPWIIKPLVSKDGAKADIERVYTQEEWFDYCKCHHLLVQVQQLIDKDYEYQLIGLSLKGGDEVIIPGYSYVLRPAPTTNTGFLRYMPLEETYQQVVKISNRFLKATGYSGLFSLEFLRGKDGNDYFMEINFRNDGNAICVTASGTNLSYIWYLYCTGGNYREEIDRSTVEPVYVMPEFADISLIAHRQLGIFTWIRDVLRTNRFMEYDKNDKAPFWKILKNFFKKVAKKTKNKFSSI